MNRYLVLALTWCLQTGLAHAGVSILPIDRILETAKQKHPHGNDNAGAPQMMRRLPEGHAREIRIYHMTSDGLRAVSRQNFSPNPNAAARDQLNAAPPADQQTTLDLSDGSDQTAYEDLGYPLTPEHLKQFRLCLHSRVEQGANILNTYWMNVLSAIAYLKFPIAYQQLRLMGFDEAYFIDGVSDVELFVALKYPQKDANGKTIPGLSVVSFRGTDSATDWIQNLKTTTSDISGHDGEAWLHEGFTEDLSEVYPSILQVLDLAHNPSPIFLTGHSLGGALAMILGIRLVARESANVAPLIGEHDDRLRGIYTWAIPRPGNAKARNILDHYLNVTRNFAVHYHVDSDPVSKLPFNWWGFRRFGLQVVLPMHPANAQEYGDRSAWTCHADVNYPGPSALSWDLWNEDVDAHKMKSYVKYVLPYRDSGAILSPDACSNAVATWGVRFADEGSSYRALSLASQLNLRECEYSTYHWGNQIE